MLSFLLLLYGDISVVSRDIVYAADVVLKCMPKDNVLVVKRLMFNLIKNVNYV